MGQLFGVYGLIGDLLLVEVRDEVLLGLELGRQLVGADQAYGPLLGLGELVAFRSGMLRKFLIISRRTWSHLRKLFFPKIRVT